MSAPCGALESIHGDPHADGRLRALSSRNRGGTLERIGVADLLRRYPYLLTGGLVPPIHVVNEVLRGGGFDAGLSGAARWEPLELSAEEYQAVVENLVSEGRLGKTLRCEQTPDWVITRSDWSNWIAERVYAIPADESRRYDAENARLFALVKDAEQRGDEASRFEHLLQLNEVCAQYSEFVQRHRKPPAGE